MAPAPAVEVLLPRFNSILFAAPHPESGTDNLEPPGFFRDLNLDQVVDALTVGREEYNLKPLFYTRLSDLDAITYRQEVMRDLEREGLFRGIKSFATQMHSMRVHLASAQKLYYRYQQEAWFLEATETYCAAVETLLCSLQREDPKSRGLLAFRTYLAAYAASSRFTTLASQATRLKAELSAISYTLLINGSSITVRHYDSERDYSAVVEATFAKFKQGATKDYLVKFPEFSGMNHVEAMVLDRVARLNPEVFAALDGYCTENRDYLDRTIAAFDREIQFYVAWLEYEETLKRAGLKFCYPRVSDTCKNVSSREGFDLALASRLIRRQSTIVCNDFELRGGERILVVTGPNQGGKTTFARVFGQLHYLASLGCRVPGAEAELYLFDRILTHFEREEAITTLRGKLEDDLVRIRGILDEATPKSIIIINEIFSSTTLKDAVYLSRNIMERISQRDSLCVCVTFLDELASLDAKTVSMVAEVVPDNPTVRTFRIARKRASGLAYALAIAEKHRLTYDRLKERFRS